MALTDKLKAIGDAIRAKTGSTDALTLDQMATTISTIKTDSTNFSIVGSTKQPTNPKENTIWANTAVAIGEWQMMASQPTVRINGTALREGDLWIATNATAKILIQAISNAGVWFRIVKVCQYIGGVWVPKTAKVYQNGVWISCNLILLEGNTISHSPKIYESSNNSCGATYTLTETGIFYKSKHDSDKNECYYNLIWEEAIDLTGYTTCYVTFGSISYDSSSKRKTGFSTTKNYAAEPASILVASSTYSPNSTCTIDVSSLTGLHYFRICGRHKDSDGYVNLYVNSVYLE